MVAIDRLSGFIFTESRSAVHLYFEPLYKFVEAFRRMVALPGLIATLVKGLIAGQENSVALSEEIRQEAVLTKQYAEGVPKLVDEYIHVRNILENLAHRLQCIETLISHNQASNVGAGPGAESLEKEIRTTRPTESKADIVRPSEATEEIAGKPFDLLADHQENSRGMGRFERETEFFEHVVHISRVTKVSRKGKSFSFSAIVVVGDGNGRVGWGVGKASEVPLAIRKGVEVARASMISVPILGTSIPHEVIGSFGRTIVVIKPVQSGAGVIADGPVRAVLEAAGIQDVLSNNLRYANPLWVIKAAFNALSQLRPNEPKATMEEHKLEQWPEGTTKLNAGETRQT